MTARPEGDAVWRSVRCATGRGAAAALLLLAACADRDVNRGRWVRDGDTAMRDVQRTGRFVNKEFNEASGVVASSVEPGVFWGNNDSGNDERLFAFDTAGRAIGTVRIRDVKNRDWEALASGPCPQGTCVYIGDIGDNSARRDNLIVHKLVEPTTTTGTVTPVASLKLAYADGPHDVEAMYAGPDGSLWLVTKRPARSATGAPRPSRVYHIPPAAWQQPGRFTATVVDSVPVTPVAGSAHDFITDGSLSSLQPDGTRRVVLLSYGAVHVLEADPATGRPGKLIARCALPIRDRNAEGVSWLPDGRILLVNEGNGGALYAGRCP
jgi:hypothetical protein